MSGVGTKVEFFPRKYLNGRGEIGSDGNVFFVEDVSGGLVWNEQGVIINPVVWEDPKIAEGTNHNLVVNTGKQNAFYNLFAMSGSAIVQFFCFGASSTAAAVGQTHLIYEHILDSTRPKLTNTDGSTLSAAAVSVTTYNDTTYTPTYVYTVQASVLGTIAAATLNVNQPVQEIGLNTASACPGTPGGTSGVLFDRYVFGSPTVLDGSTTLATTVVLHY